MLLVFSEIFRALKVYIDDDSSFQPSRFGPVCIVQSNNFFAKVVQTSSKVGGRFLVVFFEVEKMAMCWGLLLPKINHMASQRSFFVL